MSSEGITQNDLKAVLNKMTQGFRPEIQAGKIGEIRMYAGSVAPYGWLFCDGSAVSRTEYADLFDVIGTTYGSGDGSTTFNLPDLRDRFPVGAGSTYAVGGTGGEATHTLSEDEMPSHGHKATQNYDTGGYISYSGGFVCNSVVVKSGGAGTTPPNYLSGQLMTGGGQPHNNMPPFTALNFIICWYTGPTSVSEREVYISSSAPTSADGNNGDIWIQYEVVSNSE